MAHLTIHYHPCVESSSCGLCGCPTAHAVGLGLVLAEDGLASVCQDCGKQHAPSLVALLHLAQVAKRVGHISRHILTPPLEALLDLARAAEAFTHAAPEPVRKVA
jgi:hypothetical protein